MTRNKNKKTCPQQGSILRPSVYKTDALPLSYTGGVKGKALFGDAKREQSSLSPLYETNFEKVERGHVVSEKFKIDFIIDSYVVLCARSENHNDFS